MTLDQTQVELTNNLRAGLSTWHDRFRRVVGLYAHNLSDCHVRRAKNIIANGVCIAAQKVNTAPPYLG
jgi:hypothetical protein